MARRAMCLLYIGMEGVEMTRLGFLPFVVFVGFCILGVLSAQAQQDSDPGRAPTTLTVSYEGDERITGPNFDLPAQFLVFLPMAVRRADGELEGQLARGWEPSDDYRAWTVHLNPDIWWHDGVPVTAHDIAFSVELLKRPDVGYIQGDVEVEVLDDSTLVLHTAVFLEYLDYRTYYPKHVLERLDPTEFYDWEFWIRPIGNGPYRYVRHVPRTMTEFEANPDYFRGKPDIDRVILKYGTADSGLLDLLAGEVEATQINSMDLPRVENDPRFQVTYWTTPWGLQNMSILWNHRHPPLADARVRRAATLAIDRREILSAMNLPPDLPLTDVAYTERQWRDLPDPLPHDPAAARQLLEESGWRDVDGDGYRERDGVPLSFEALTAVGRGDRASVIVQEHLRRVGIRMEIEAATDFLTRAYQGTFEAAVTWMTPPPAYLSQLGWENARVADLVAAIDSTGNPVVVDSLYRELWPEYQSDVPITYLYPIVEYWVSDRRLQGLSSPFRGDPVWYMEYLWMANNHEPEP